jgi:preprotein translocase subunit SecA
MFHLQFVREDQPPQSRTAVADGAPNGRGPNGLPGGHGQGEPVGAGTSGAKIGRNDPCWCGSGRKFKRCHGR